MKMRDVIIKAITEQDGKLAVQIADDMRFRGFNYKMVYKTVNGVIPIELPDWDALLYEGES